MANTVNNNNETVRVQTMSKKMKGIERVNYYTKGEFFGQLPNSFEKVKRMPIL